MTPPVHVLELRSVRGTGGGPEKTILTGAQRTDPRRIRVTVCYIRDRRDSLFGVDTRAARAGVDYVEIHERHSFDHAVWPALRVLVQERQINIVHAHDYKTDLLALLLARSDRVIPLATAHGWTGHSRRERWLYYPADRRLLRRFPAVIAVSSEIRRTLVAAGVRADRVATIVNGIAAGAFRRDRLGEAEARAKLGLTRGDLVIGAVGRLERQKRFDILLSAVGQLVARGYPVKLVIAGDGSLREELQRMADALGVASACRLVGHSVDVAAVHQALNLFVQSSDYEGTSNAVLEAMALETPIVATDVGGTRDLIRDGIDGLLVPPGSVTALAGAIAQALDDGVATDRRVAAARARVEAELSFETRMRAVESVYETLAGARVTRPREASRCA